MTDAIVRGRPKKYSEYERLYAGLPKPMKRPSYINNIGILRGVKRESAYIKICMTNGGVYEGKTYARGDYVEINLGKLSSFTWKQLEEKLAELQGKADRGEPLHDIPMVTFQNYTDGWHERAKTRVKSRGTIRYHVGRYLLPKFGTRALDSISTSDVNNWIAELRETLNPATVKRIYNTLRAIFNDAIRAGILHSNPCNNSDKITGIVSRQRFLEPAEIVLLYSAAKEKADWLADFILWAIHSGMRKSEMRTLQWNDVSVMQNGRVFAIIKTSKSGKPRLIECTKTMQGILDRQKKRIRKGNDMIFSTPLITLTRYWQDLRNSAGLKDICLHDLRRTHASHIAAANVDLNTLAARLGHTDLTMLQKHYAVIIGAAESKATSTIEQVFDDIINRKKANARATKPAKAKKSA